MLAAALLCVSYYASLSQPKYFLIETADSGSRRDYLEKQKGYQDSAKLTEGPNIKIPHTRDTESLDQ